MAEKKKTKKSKKDTPEKKPKKEMTPEEKAKRAKLIHDIAWVITGIIFLFVLVSIITPNSTGAVGKFINKTFFDTFGVAAYLLPLLAIYVVLHTLLKITDMEVHWVILLCLVLQFDATLFLYQVGPKSDLAKAGGGSVGWFLGHITLGPVGNFGRWLITIGLGLISIMLLTRLSLKQIYEFFKPVGKFIIKAGKNVYNFLAFRQDEDEEKLLKAPISKVPDLSSLEEKEEEEPEEAEEEEEPEPEPEEEEEEEQPEESEEVELVKARDTVETAALTPSTLETPSPLVGTEDGKPGGYEKLKEDSGEIELSDSGRLKYEMPPVSLLKKPEKEDEEKSVRDYSEKLEQTLADFKVDVKVINKVRGPTVTRYELQPAKGVKVKKVTSLSNDIALALAAYSIRIEAPIPGKSAIGVEIPNYRIDPVLMREILEQAKYKKLSPLSLALGKDITGKAVTGDLVKMPHVLIAGATGSGKSVCINCVIASILYKATPYDVQMLMVDPKRVELSLYEGIPHLIDVQTESGKKIITDPKTATLALKTISEIMDQRYEDFVALKVRNIKEFNAKAEEKIPYIVVIIDELADLMMVSSSTVEQYICRIAQLGRASGIHMILATQRPSVNVITGLIKANIPSRIAFAVSSQVDSRTILDRVGAEKLLGKGDMLYLPVDSSDPKRIQGAFVSGDEIEKVVDFWKTQPPPENIIPIEIPEEEGKMIKADDDDDKDPLINDAINVIKTTKQASVSNLQRKMKIGYARAGRIMDQMEQMGIVGPADGSKPRKILIPGYDTP